MAQDILTLVVNVFGVDDIPLELSSVTYQQKGDKEPRGTITESDFGTEHVAYLAPATVTLFITAPGYRDTKLELDLSKEKADIVTENVTLKPLKRIDVKIGGKKQALAAQPDTIVAYLATTSEPEVDRLEKLFAGVGDDPAGESKSEDPDAKDPDPQKEGDGSEKKNSGDEPDDKGMAKTPRKAGLIVISGEGKVGSAKRRKQLARIRSEKDVLVAGPVIGQNKEGPMILTEWANLTLDPWLNQDQVAELLESLKLTYVELIPGSGNVYRVCFKGEYGLDLLKRLEEIEQEKGILAAEPAIYQNTLKDVVPNDWALPYAWSRRFQVRADLAWDEVRGELGVGPPDRTYGDPDVIVAVFDEGVLSVGGVPDNPEFQGTVSDTANTNLTAALAAPRSVITVDSTAGIAVGNRISVGRGTDQNKRVYAVNAGANQLTIDPLHFDHPGRAVVLNTGTGAVLTRLAAGGVTMNTETLTVASNAGFRIGQSISVGAEGAANTEQAVITALPGTNITVRGLNLAHANATQVQSGRKTYRYQDFATANFGPNNDNTVQMHGEACAGIVLATADNAIGAAGMAPNVRLMGVQIQSGKPVGANQASFQWAAGLVNYNLHGPSPFTPGYLAHGVDIISSSLGYNEAGGLSANTLAAITNVTRGGRNRRGTLIFLSAGNGNTTMAATRWSAHQNTFAVAASMLGQFPAVGAGTAFTKEVRAFYSNYSLQPLGTVPNDITFTAISGYTFIPGTANLIGRSSGQAHNPPASHYIVSTAFRNRGNVPDSITNTANVTVAAPANNTYARINQSIRQGDTSIQVSSIAGFAVGDWIRLGQWTDAPNNQVQWVQVVAPAPAAGVINCTAVGADHPIFVPNTSTLTTRNNSATALVTVGATAAGAGNIVVNVLWAAVGNYISNGASIVRIAGTSYRVTGSAASGVNTSLAVTPAVPAGGIPAGTGIAIAGNCNFAIVNSTVVTVDSTAGFVANEWVMVGNPANSNCVMSHVHAVNPAGANTLRISGPENAVTAAPATPIHRGPLNYQNRFNGTSAAAPNAAGIGALILSAKPTLTWLEVRNIMQSTARKIDVGNIGFDLAPGGANDGRSGPANFGRWYDAAGNPIMTVPGNAFFAVGMADATVGASAQGATTITVGAAANFAVGQAISIGAANPDFSEVIARNLGTNQLTIEPLSQPWPGGTVVQGGRTPAFSGWYGPGRLDPTRALQIARAYSHDDRDLMIRNYLGDPGNVATNPAVNPIISPDIFLRNANDIVGGPALNYNQAPPHQNPANGITAPVFAGGGVDDLRVRGIFRGAAAAVYVVRVDGVGPDTVEWSVDGGVTYTNPGTPIVANTDINLPNGVVIRFAAAAGHVMGDTWTINVAPANHFIHVRVGNRGVGAGMASLPGTYIRYYVALTDGTLLGNGNTPFYLPPGWDDSTLVGAGGIATNTESAIYLIPNPLATNPGGIGDNIPNNTPLAVGVNAVTINSGANMIFPCQWNNVDVPPATLNLKAFLLAEVLPHDGVMAGVSPDANNNISYREIFFGDADFLDGAGTAALTQNFEVPNTGAVANLPFTVHFKANWSNFVTENVELVLTTRDDSGTVVNVVYEHNGAAWGVVGGAPAWANFNAPVLTGTATPAAGNQVEITFTGSIDLTDTINLFTPTLRYRGVHDAIVFEEKHEIVVFHEPVLLPNPGNGIAPAETPRLHEFAAMLNLTAQPGIADAFGVDPGNSPATRFRITTRFVNAAPVRAYAVMKGQIFVQQADNDRVNLILRPFEQSGMGFTPVKYFVYRGLRLGDFLAGPANPANRQVRARAGASDFIESCYQINDDINAALGTADVITPKAFGWDPDNQTDPNAYLDDYFFAPDPSHQLAVAEKGMWLGEFVGNGALDSGFEVVLLDTRAVLDLNYARATDHVINVPAVLPALEQKARKEAVLGWIDPAALYGMHYFAGAIQAGPTVRRRVDLYNDIMAPFWNKNRVYLDVRNETGYSLNYYGNYIGPVAAPDQLHSIKLRDPSQATAVSQTYGTGGWPLLWTDLAQPGGKIVNLWYLTLRIADNVTPLLYAQHAQYITPHVRDRFVEGANLVGVDPQWTIEAGVSYPNFNSTGTNVSTVLKFYYYRQLPSPPGNAVVVRTDDYTDNIFASIELLIRERPITGVNQGTQTFTVAGNFTDGIDVGESVAVAGATGGGGANNLTYTVTAVNFAAGNTNITVAQAIPNATADGMLQFNYSQWNTNQPTRWFSGTRKHYVDTVNNPVDGAGNPLIATGMVGESGIAVENARIILYVTPYHFFQQNLTRSINRINLKGGVGLEDSFWTEIQNQNGNLDLSATILVLGGGTQIPVFELDELDPAGGADKPENVMAICISDAEFSKIRQAMNENGLSPFHTKALNVTLVGGGVQMDNNGINYRQYDIRIRGWNAAGNYTEINSSTVADPNPVVVYTLDSNRMIYTSEDFSNLENLVDIPDQPEENRRSNTEALAILGGDAAMNTLVGQFNTDLAALNNDKAAIENLIETRSKALWDQAVNYHDSAPFDDRPLYWARLHFRAAIRLHPWLQKQRKLTRNLIKLVEEESRGMTRVDFTASNSEWISQGVNFGIAKKILIVGFDPFGLDSTVPGGVDPENASAQAVLHLHNKKLTSGAFEGMVQGIILPFRYKDFDRKIVEKFMEKYLEPGSPDKVDMVLTMNQYGLLDRYYLDRFAGRLRTAATDNNDVAAKQKSIGFGFSYDEFFETTVPVGQIVPAGGGAWATAIVYNQHYVSSAGNEPTPANGGANTNNNTVIAPSGKSVEGSAGNSLSNEVFYRVARLRERLSSTTLTGHLSIPSEPTSAGESRADIVSLVQTALENSLSAL